MLRRRAEGFKAVTLAAILRACGHTLPVIMHAAQLRA